MAEGIEHKGHDIAVLRRTGGWRVYIRPPDAPMTRADFPDALSRDEVIAQAIALIDQTLAAAPQPRRRR